MTAPSPRPALRRAPDADVHPAAPGGIPAPADRPAATTLTPLPTPRLHRLSAPPRGTTSDSLRAKPQRTPAPRGRGGKKAPKEKTVDLGIKVPKSLRKELRAAAKSAGRTPDEVVVSLIRAWVDN